MTSTVYNPAKPIPPAKTVLGLSLIEVLVTLVVIAIGLFGLTGLIARMQISEMESYQRTQALILLNDMASRISANRENAAAYLTAAPLGSGMTCPTASATPQQTDASEWCNLLQGAAEVLGGNNVGAMVGGRGCIESLGGADYLISVVWQGLAPISAPATTCGQGNYDGAAGSACANDQCRRAVTTVIRIGNLS